METFNFPYHKTRTEYPESAPNIQLGKSYIFVAKPQGPDQRKFILTFQSMKWYTNSNGTLDLTTNPTLNFGALDKFYRDHRTYLPFYYQHPAYGLMECRFAIPFKHPDAIEGGTGQTEQFEIQLIEVVG